MKSLVDFGHSLGLKVGSYLNNCICMDKDPDPKYEQDVAWFMSAGFDEVQQAFIHLVTIATTSVSAPLSDGHDRYGPAGIRRRNLSTQSRNGRPPYTRNIGKDRQLRE
jgi:hypothetical protein